MPNDLASSQILQTHITVDLRQDMGPLELWRHTFGRGGINPLPPSDRVTAGMAKLQPRLVRVFLQEFFQIYPDHGVFDWSRLDRFMQSMAKIGGKILAAICIKPKVLFPAIDQRIWRPNDVAEWQRVIAALVQRYSVDQNLVTHWSIGNEVDIGEDGGTPFLIADAEDYAAFYAMTVKPIRETFPQAKVGGPAAANPGGDFIERFVNICARDVHPLDFIAWHLYADDPALHAGFVDKYRRVLNKFPGTRPEMMITEWNKGFDAISVEDLAFHPRRAANTAACLLALLNAKVDWTFYYHFEDQVCYTPDFAPFFERPQIMYHHWNEVPHRFGLFGVGGEVRPQYFVYQMLQRLGAQRVATGTNELLALAAGTAERCSVFLVNFSQPRSEDRVANVRFSGLSAGVRELRVYRIDDRRRWNSDTLELIPVERRETYVEETFECQIFLPADAVALVELLPPVPQ